MQQLSVVILAAGKGKRMVSDLPKVLHRIAGKPLLGHVLATASQLEATTRLVVYGHGGEAVKAAFAGDSDVVWVEQAEQLGTGHAVAQALPSIDPAGVVLVLYGDVPLIRAETLQPLVMAAQQGHLALLTVELADPAGYGRIVRDAEGLVARIVEQKDATEQERAICEINSGIYAFDATLLRAALAQLTTDNAQGEKYVTDVLGIARSGGARVGAFVLADYWQCEGVNDKVQLARLGAELNRRTVESAMRAGAIVVDPATTWIDADVSVGTDTVIHPNSQVLGATTIGAGAVIGPDTTLRDMEVGDGASVVRTHAELSVVGAGCTVGPWAHLRPGTELGPDSVVRSFVETKNVVAAAGSVIPQLTYVGDTMIEAQAAGPGE